MNTLPEIAVAVTAALALTTGLTLIVWMTHSLSRVLAARPRRTTFVPVLRYARTA